MVNISTVPTRVLCAPRYAPFRTTAALLWWYCSIRLRYFQSLVPVDEKYAQQCNLHLRILHVLSLPGRTESFWHCVEVDSDQWLYILSFDLISSVFPRCCWYCDCCEAIRDRSSDLLFHRFVTPGWWAWLAGSALLFLSTSLDVVATVSTYCSTRKRLLQPKVYLTVDLLTVSPWSCVRSGS